MALGPGHHLLIDSKPRHSITQESIFFFLKDCPDAVGMTRITTPQIGWKDDTNTIAGFVIIAESHISVHAANRPKQAGGPAVFVDVFSCKPIPDPKAIVNFAVKTLGLTRSRTSHQVIVREMPDSIPSLSPHSRSSSS